MDNVPLPQNNEGGFLVPEKLTVAKRGIIAWFFRLVGDKRGYEEINWHKRIWEWARKSSIVREK